MIQYVDDCRSSFATFDYSDLSSKLSYWQRFKLALGSFIAWLIGPALSILIGKSISFAVTYKEGGEIIKVKVLEVGK